MGAEGQTSTMATFRENFIHALRVSGHTVRSFANEIGVSSATVGHWRTGKAKSRMDRLTLIAQKLSTTVAHLVDNDPDFAHTKLESAALYAFRDLSEEQQVAAIQLMASIKAK